MTAGGRAVIYLAAFVVILAIAGCGDDTTTIINKTAPTTTPSTPQKTTSTAGQADGGGASASCGKVDFSGSPTTIVVLRGTECAEAIRIATAYAASPTPPHPWTCGLAHAPFDTYPLPDDPRAIIGFSCGYGLVSGDLRSAPHAFVGVAPKP